MGSKISFLSLNYARLNAKEALVITNQTQNGWEKKRGLVGQLGRGVCRGVTAGVGGLRGEVAGESEGTSTEGCLLGMRLALTGE